jgi:hypothetical protein
MKRLILCGDETAMIVPGCGDVLCDANVLLSALSFGQQFPAECAATTDADSSPSAESDCTSDRMSMSFWVSMIFVTLLVGAASSAFITAQYRFGGKNATSTTGLTIMATSTTATITPPVVMIASATTVLRDSEGGVTMATATAAGIINPILAHSQA